MAWDASSFGLPAIVAAYAAMLLVPGPSFMVVMAASLGTSRQAAAITAIGVACGTGLLILLTTQAAALLPHAQVMTDWSSAAGSVVLLFVGFRALRRGLLPGQTLLTGGTTPDKGANCFLLGMVTALTNPISFSFFASIAVAVRSLPNGEWRLVPVSIFLMAFGWFSLLSLVLSLPWMRRIYSRSARSLDFATGAILVVMAMRM